MAKNQLMVTIAVMSATIMQVLDTSIINVALPDMQGSFSANPDEISWILTSYLVSSAIFLPLTGFFSDMLGRKSYLLWSIFGFTIASMLCGASVTLGEIVIFRILQGIFGACLVPLSQAIMADNYPPEERGKAMAIWGMGVMIGPILGPTLGGYLTDALDWRWNFYVNVPVGILSLGIAWKYVEESELRARELDWTGFILLGLGIGALQFTLDRGNQEDWFESSLICITSLLTLIGIFGFIVYSKYYNSKPIFNLEILKDRNFWASSVIITFMGLGMFGAMVIQPIMLSSLFDYPALIIGLIMAPRGVASFFGMYLVGKTINKVPAKNYIAAGLLIAMFGNLLATNYNLQMGLFTLILPILFQGFGLGLIFVPLSNLCLSTLPKKDMAEASGLFSLMRTIGFSAGTSVVITYFTREGQQAWNQLGGFINPYNQNVYTYLNGLHLRPNELVGAKVLSLELIKQAQMQAVVNVFYMIAICFFLMLPLVLLLENKKSSQSEHLVAET